jgi:hypothetical protein
MLLLETNSITTTTSLHGTIVPWPAWFWWYMAVALAVVVLGGGVLFAWFARRR